MKDPFDHSDGSGRLILENLPKQVTPFQRFVHFFAQFRRFGWDLIGLVLISLAILSLFGLFKWSTGYLIDQWTVLISRIFGWGSIIVIIMVALTGVSALLHSAGKRFPLSFGKVLAIEGAFFSLLAALAEFGGLSIDRAEAGQDGGIIGWGLGSILPGFVGGLIYSLLFLALVLIATGLFNKVIKKFTTLFGSSKTEERKLPEPEPRKVQEAKKIQTKTEPIDDIANILVRDHQLPPLNLLMSEHNVPPDQAHIRARAQTIEKTLEEFGLPVKVIGFRVGPTVTQFALEPGYISRVSTDGSLAKQKVRVSQISALSRDLALALSASRLRIETPVPGRSFVGVEVPNNDNNVVRLRPILESSEFRKLQSPLALGLGRNVSGEALVADLEKMPHLLIAGTTNSGKSVCITALTTCLVMNNSPQELKLVMLDPKMVELVRFNGLPHLLGKVETRLERMLAVLRWALAEMDSRYRVLAEARARNIESYNLKMIQKKQSTMPRIVILIDELADLMMSAPDQTEHSLIRLAQMARATGIHLIVATQRPSTDVVTGLIKANFPARISFSVASSIDSRVILDASGAETLLGKGDMLYLDPTRSGLTRLQGILINDTEIEKVVNHWRRISSTEGDNEAPWEAMAEESDASDEVDQLAEQAIGVVKAAGKASVSLLQRRLRIGYPRAARLMDELEEMGIVGPSVGSGKDREVLIDPDDEASSEFESD